MYRNALTPSKLLGIILLLFAAAGALTWAGCFLDVEAFAFDARGWALLGAAGALLTLGLLFLRRARWVRLPTSILLHLLALALLATLPFTIPGQSLAVQTALLALTLLAVGLLFIGILALHGEAMKSDLARGPGERLVKPMHMAAGGACVLSLAALGVWHLAPLLTAQPIITVDYEARANQAHKPAPYDPSRNAAPHYEKLLAQFTPLPETLKDKWKSWPADLNPDEYKALEEWAPRNESVLPSLSQAAQCLYWWYELKSTDGSLSAIQTTDLDQLRNCTWSVLVLSKFQASRGDADGAFQLLADLHMLGIHQIRNGTLVEQLTGLAVCGITCDALLAILDRSEVKQPALQRMLDALAPRVPQINVPRFSEVERLYGRDRVQRAFTSDSHGSGRLIPRCLYDYKKEHAGYYRSPIPYLDAVRISVTHPHRRETLVLFEDYFTKAKRLARQTPWELRVHDESYEQQVSQLLSANYFLRDGFGSMGRCIRLGWRGRTCGAGTVLVLAVFTYQSREGRLPQSLPDLVDAGLLPSVPIDPYSGQPFVYRATDKDFTLYSVGEDCTDNGGLPCGWNDETDGDHVFWPLRRGTAENAGENET